MAALLSFVLIATVSIVSFLAQTTYAHKQERHRIANVNKDAVATVTTSLQGIESLGQQAAALYPTDPEHFSNKLSEYVNQVNITSDFPSIPFVGFVTSGSQGTLTIASVAQRSNNASASITNIQGTPISQMINIDEQYGAARETGKTQISRPFITKTLSTSDSAHTNAHPCLR